MGLVEKMVLERFRELIMRRVRLHSLILFGSRARGDADPDSDMDVVVVLEGGLDDEIRDYVSDCAWEAGFQYGMVVVPIVLAREEWEKGPERLSLLFQAVKAEGILV